MSSSLKAKLLKRMLLGVASEKEKQQVYSSKESNRMLEQLWLEDTSEISRSIPFDKQKVFQHINNRITTDNKKAVSWHHSLIFRIAASVTVLFALSISVFYILRNNGILAQKQLLSVTNANNSAMEVILPDSSKVVLNRQSTLKYPKAFNSRVRQVELSGEAIFKVTHKPKHPFVVSANRIEVEVLGTEFNLMAYPTDDMVTTTLISGKVKVTHFDSKQRKEQSIILAPNHSATFIYSQNRFEIKKAEVNSVTAWERGELIFNDEPLESIVSKLTHWYNVEFIISNDLKGKYRLTMTIDEETLDEALLIISKTLPIGYSKSEKQVLIYSKQ